MIIPRRFNLEKKNKAFVFQYLYVFLKKAKSAKTSKQKKAFLEIYLTSEMVFEGKEKGICILKAKLQPDIS